jgi:hypothetical protein
MNCDNCQNLLSEFVDNHIDHSMSAEITAHLDMCGDCADVHRDFTELTGFCTVYQEEEVTPPNSQALWCRINNIIESENQQIAETKVEEKKKAGFWEAVWARNWQLSLSQMVSAVIGIAVVSSLLTVVGIRNGGRAPGVAQANASLQPSLVDSLLSKAGLAEAPEQAREKSFSEKQVVIDYWNKRVDERKTQWSPKMQDTFARNLNEIDQVVFEYSENLKTNPEDSLTEEMLNSALTEKMELLREFSEL